MSLQDPSLASTNDFFQAQNDYAIANLISTDKFSVRGEHRLRQEHLPCQLLHVWCMFISDLN